jgi:hypothetical protein
VTNTQSGEDRISGLSGPGRQKTRVRCPPHTFISLSSSSPCLRCMYTEPAFFLYVFAILITPTASAPMPAPSTFPMYCTARGFGMSQSDQRLSYDPTSVFCLPVQRVPDLCQDIMPPSCNEIAPTIVPMDSTALMGNSAAILTRCCPSYPSHGWQLLRQNMLIPEADLYCRVSGCSADEYSEFFSNPILCASGHRALYTLRNE